jgi:hypothetical protein
MGPLHVNTPPTNGGQGPAIKVSGKKLAKWRRMGLITPDFAARLAHALQVGAVVVGNFTPTQACAVTGTTVASLASVRRKHRQANGNGHARVLYRREVSEADIDAVIAKLGADRIMKALDRYTQPQMFAAE